MAALPKPDALNCSRSLALAVCLSVAACSAIGQTRVTLDRLETRKLPDFISVYDHQSVLIRALVSAEVYHIPGFTILPLQDEKAGAVLQVPAQHSQLNDARPGDELE